VLGDLGAAVRHLASRDDVGPTASASPASAWAASTRCSPRSVDGLAACAAGTLRYAEKTGQPASPLELAPQLRCPYLGLFGADDAIIPQADVDELRAILDRTDQPHEIRVYAGAGHAFFNDTRPDAYRPDAAADAWPRALAFLHRHLG
jgi:dienelactone hydrolase